MPKGARGEKKGKGAPRRRGGRDQEEDETPDDIASVAGSGGTACAAGLSSDSEGAEDGPEGIDDTRSRIDDFLTQTEHKNGGTRERGLSGLCLMFSKSYLPDNLESMQETLLAAIVRVLKRGGDAEKTQAARLATILLLQLGCSDEAARYVDELTPVLETIFSDHTKSAALRAAASRALSLGGFVVGEALDNVALVKRFRESLQSSSKQLADAVVTSILSSCALLLTRIPDRIVMSQADMYIAEFSPYLEAKDPLTRVASGEAIAVVYERAWKADTDFVSGCHEDVVATLKTLATDHCHHRSRSEKKEGRAQFRPIVMYLEQRSNPEEALVLSKHQSLRMRSWSDIKTYSFFRDVLASGMLLHLNENSFVREVFGLGASLPPGEATEYSKDEKRRIYSSMKLQRHLDRNYFRDKRSACF